MQDLWVSSFPNPSQSWANFGVALGYSGPFPVIFKYFQPRTAIPQTLGNLFQTVFVNVTGSKPNKNGFEVLSFTHRSCPGTSRGAIN